MEKIKKTVGYIAPCNKHHVFMTFEDAVNCCLEEIANKVFNVIYNEEGDVKEYRSKKAKIKAMKNYLKESLKLIEGFE